MLQGVAINLVAFARYRGNLQGQVFVLFMLTVAACEAGIALALILMLYRKRHSLDVSLWQDLREAGQEPMDDEEPLPPEPAEPPLPTLTPTGHEPKPHEPAGSECDDAADVLRKTTAATDPLAHARLLPLDWAQ